METTTITLKENKEPPVYSSALFHYDPKSRHFTTRIEKVSKFQEKIGVRSEVTGKVVIFTLDEIDECGFFFSNAETKTRLTVRRSEF